VHCHRNSNFGLSAASLLANAATRSVIDGTDFGDNIIAALPDAIIDTIGNVIKHGVAAQLKIEDSVYWQEDGVTGGGSGAIAFTGTAILGSAPLLPVGDGANEYYKTASLNGGGGRRRIQANSQRDHFQLIVGLDGKLELVYVQVEKGAAPESEKPVATPVRPKPKIAIKPRTTNTSNAIDIAPLRAAEAMAMPISAVAVTDTIDVPVFSLDLTVAPDISRGYSISTYTPSHWGNITSSLFTSTNSGYQLRDTAYADWNSGSYAKGGAKYVGSLGLRALQATQWAAFETPVALLSGHGFNVTAQDRQDAGIISFAAGGLGGIRRGAVGAAERAVPNGIVYLRTDITGKLSPYGGQAINDARFLARQAEHARAFPNSEFKFSIIDRANPGRSLDIAEHNYIQELTGGVAARRSSAVSNLRDPVGAARRPTFGLPEPK
jgi:hypothetical protein